MKNYCLLCYVPTNEPDSKITFLLHEGENSIGTEKDCDIHLQQDNNINIAYPIHVKIIVSRQNNFLDVGIKIIKVSSAYIKKDDNKKILLPEREYELPMNSIFYLNNSHKFRLIKGTIEEIKIILLSANLEMEFQKWHRKIIENEKKNNLNAASNKKNSADLKDDIDKNANSENNNNNQLVWNDCQIVQNEFFSIKKPKNSACEEKPKASTEYLNKTSSTSSTENKSVKRKIDLDINKKNLLHLYDINLNDEKIENIYQEKENFMRLLLGENGLDNILFSTNFQLIRKYDKFYYHLK